MNAKESPALAATRKPGDVELLHALKHTPEGKEWECPCCGRVLPFQTFDWLNALAVLLSRYAGELGISPDMAGLTLIELWGVYQWLNRIGG